METFEQFARRAKERGFDEAVERVWAPHTVVETHVHEFILQAVMVRGELWLTCDGTTRRLLPGDTFALSLMQPHSERYGAEGAVYWVERRRAPIAAPVRLRPATLDDARAMAALLEHDAAAVETTGRIRIPCTVDAAREWLGLVLQPAPEGGLSLACTIEDSAGQVLGNLGCWGTLAEVEVGYWVGRPFWGRGVASQALALLLEELRARGVRRVRADTVAGNAGSDRVLEKAGFACEGDGEEDNPLRGRRKLRLWGRGL